MNFLPTVSVIVAVFNAEKTIEDCLQSLLKLNYPREKLELILVDNGSTDKTRTLMERHNGAFHIVKEEKRGPAAARNRGLRKAKGEVIAFTDSDCVVDDNWLLHIVSPLQDLQVGAVGGRILSKGPDAIQRFYEQVSDHERAIRKFKPPYVITMNWASRMSVLSEAGLFDENLRRGEDVDLSFRMQQSGYSFVFQPDAIIYHQNEPTLGSLFRKGYLHGYYSVPLLKKHKDYVRSFGHRRIPVRVYRELLSSAVRVWRKDMRADPAMCRFVFDSGKRIGKAFGSVRFFYLEL